MTAVRHPLSHILAAALLTAMTFLVYWAGLSGGFIFDDIPNLVLDPDWKAADLDPAQLLRALRHGVASPTGRPLALLSFAINHALTGMDPFWLKLTSLLLHISNGLLVWLLCRAIFVRLPAFAASPRPGIGTATLLAAAWLLHPLQVSSVLYIVQRMELGAAMGALLALLTYMRARRLQIAGRAGWPWLVVAAGAMLFGVGFKETALLTPGFAFLIELCVLRFAGADGRASRIWIAAYAIGFLLAILVFVMVVLPMSGPDSGYEMRAFDRTQRLLTQLPVLALYLQQIVLPIPETMTFYYDDFPISHGLISPPATAAAAVMLSALVGLAFASWRRWPLVSLGLGWFFFAHALTSNVLPLELVFEHRNYLALLGVLLALVTPVHALARRLNADVRIVAVSMPVLVLATLCWLQVSTWGDPMRLAWTLENRNPGSTRAVYGLGKEFLLSSGNDPNTPAWSMARAQFLRAAELSAVPTLPLQGVLVMDGRQGRAIPSETWKRFREALNKKPIGFEGLSGLYAVSDCRIAGKCKFDDRELLQTFLETVARNPRNPEVHTMYANFAWNVLGDPELAIAMQREAVQLSPNTPALRVALAKFLLASGDPECTIEGRRLTDALRLENRDGALSSTLEELGGLEYATNGGSRKAELAPQ